MAVNKTACVILNYNDADETVELAKAIDQFDMIDYVIIVDSHSTDDSLDRIKMIKSKNVILLEQDENRGYGVGNNAGVFYAYYKLKCERAIICNPDVEFTDKCVKNMSDVMDAESDVAVIAPLQYFPNGTIEKEYAWKIPTIKQWILSPEHLLHKKYWPSYTMSELDECRSSGRKYKDVDCVPGAMLMVDAKSFVESGGYDERNFLYCEETTLAIKMKSLNRRTLIMTDERYIHHVSTTVKKNVNGRVKRKALMMKSRCQFLRDWLQANSFECWLGRRFADIAVFETWIDCILNKDK